MNMLLEEIAVRTSSMDIESVKAKLYEANTAQEREVAIKTALISGMSLTDIEEYLDWVDAVKNQPNMLDDHSSESPLAD